MLRLVLLALVLLMQIWFCPAPSAHESQPATLELKQIAKHSYEVIWRAPIYYGRPHPARLVLPESWQDVVEPSMTMLPDSQVFRQVVMTDGESTAGKVIGFPGLENTITTVFVRFIGVDGTTSNAAVRPSKPFISLHGERAWYQSAGEYVMLGMYHILQGVDHLLFVLGLLLIVKGRLKLIKTVTAFTVAHSITLGIATLGFASVPLPPLNAAIALSILFLGPEIVRSWKGQSSMTISYPWLVAFFFGLLHGFGFASGLSTTGMPDAEILIALLFFNGGVELGQLAFIFMVLGLIRSFKVLEIHWPRPVEALPGYAVGSLGAYWTIQRTVILLGVM